MNPPALTIVVIAGLDPAIHCSGWSPASAVDARITRGHDEWDRRRSEKVGPVP
jgi:hypothetical protein